MSERARFEQAKQLILSIFGVISTLTTFEVVRQWDHLTWGYLILAFTAIVLFVDKLEFLELIHPEGQRYTFPILVMDLLDVSSYALALSMLIDKHVSVTARFAAFFWVFAAMFILFLVRTFWALGRLCKLNLGSLAGTLASVCAAVLFETGTLEKNSINSVAVIAFILVAIYLCFVQMTGRAKAIELSATLVVSPSGVGRETSTFLRQAFHEHRLVRETRTLIAFILGRDGPGDDGARKPKR